MDIQFFHKVGAVFLHRFHADVEEVGDLPVFISLCNKLQDFSLAFGEGIPGCFCNPVFLFHLGLSPPFGDSPRADPLRFGP